MSPACPVFGFRVEIDTRGAQLDNLERQLVALAHARGLIVDRVYDGPARRRRNEIGEDESIAFDDLSRIDRDWAREHRDEVVANVGLLEDVGTLA